MNQDMERVRGEIENLRQFAGIEIDTCNRQIAKTEVEPFALELRAERATHAHYERRLLHVLAIIDQLAAAR